MEPDVKIPDMHVDIEPTREGEYLVTLTSNGTRYYTSAEKTVTQWGARRVARRMLRRERKYWTKTTEKVTE